MEKPLLSPSDLSAIEAAVREAETRTTGEIYCVAAETSSDYRETPLAWATAVSLLAPALLLMAGVHVEAPDLFDGWTAAQVAGVAETAVRDALIGAVMLQGVLFVLTWALVSWRPLRQALTLPAAKRERVRERAREQFIAKNLHATRERTGVLIYVSFAEHMAEIIADEGIAEKTPSDAWEGPMAALIAGLKRGEPAAGFAAAIGACADLLAASFPCRPDDNPNELPDAVIVLPRA